MLPWMAWRLRGRRVQSSDHVARGSGWAWGGPAVQWGCLGQGGRARGVVTHSLDT